jgi:hypothetical protein
MKGFETAPDFPMKVKDKRMCHIGHWYDEANIRVYL